MVIAEGVPTQDGVQRIRQGQVGQERPPPVGVVEMVAVVDNVRGNASRTQDAEALGEEGRQLFRRVVLERAAGVAQVDRA